VSAATGAASRGSERTESESNTSREPALIAVVVDKDNIMFSPADDSAGANFAKIVEYQQEWLAGDRVLGIANTPKPCSTEQSR